MILLIKSAGLVVHAVILAACLYMAVITTKGDHPIYEKLPIVVARIFRLGGMLFAIVTSWFFVDTVLHRMAGLPEFEFKFLVWYEDYPVLFSIACLSFISVSFAYCLRSPSSEGMAWAILGKIVFQFEAYDVALGLLQRAVHLNSKLIDAHSQLAFINVAMGEYDRAISHGNAALAILPTHYLALLARGSAYFKKQTH